MRRLLMYLVPTVVVLWPALLKADDKPDAHHPVVASATIQPAMGHAGDTVTLTITVKTAMGWHIYGHTSKGVEVATEIKVGPLPKGVTTKGDWNWPEPEPGEEGSKIYQGEVSIKRSLKLASDAPTGSFTIPCEMKYQACTMTSCKPPATMKLKATGAVK